jgi:hypothetical protein
MQDVGSVPKLMPVSTISCPPSANALQNMEFESVPTDRRHEENKVPSSDPSRKSSNAPVKPTVTQTVKKTSSKGMIVSRQFAQVT